MSAAVVSAASSLVALAAPLDALLAEADALAEHFLNLPKHQEPDLTRSRLMLLRVLRAASRDDNLEEHVEAFFLLEKEPWHGASTDFFDASARVAQELKARPVSRLMPDDELTPLLLTVFRKHLASLLEPTDDAATLEEQFVISLSRIVRPSFFSFPVMGMDYETTCWEEEAIAKSRKNYYLDRCNWVDALVWGLEGRRHNGPSVEKCLEKLGGADKLATHVLPWARCDEHRELIRRSVGCSKRHKQ